MSKLIALVATAVLIGGVRTVIQPGEELPDLTKHDERELLASGAAQNPEDVDAEQRAADREVQAAGQDFEDARARVQQAAESTATAGAPSDAPVGEQADAGAKGDGSAAAQTAEPADEPAKPAKAEATATAKKKKE